ncbi:hypothetical protein B0H16DRAFT_1733058 [Mycena metata]|uniref:BTB domain-containing protein n=1 Tax=Mycena metata TaxID=1033252 RepID=A0AAD7HZJ6_9AGAR|nr:hypothetical protein B0H16DRAFT_1733058 [Mycena metata]
MLPSSSASHSPLGLLTVPHPRVRRHAAPSAHAWSVRNLRTHTAAGAVVPCVSFAFASGPHAHSCQTRTRWLPCAAWDRTLSLLSSPRTALPSSSLSEPVSYFVLGSRMSLLALKRPRTEDDPSALPFTRSKIWYYDGSIVLQAEQTQFRVHASLLSAGSTVFKDIFELARDPSNVDAQVEGCPLKRQM